MFSSEAKISDLLFLIEHYSNKTVIIRYYQLPESTVLNVIKNKIATPTENKKKI